MISQATEELNELIDENEKLKSLVGKEEVLEDKFTDINKKLPENQPLGTKELLTICDKIYNNPNQYSDIIKSMRQRYLHNVK
jgi:uncharacterized coiled-coil DUF342 family protein